jgi:hypothetical protein
VSTAPKRVKSRPASVSSLGSIIQSSTSKKPHQLKTRAVSAILTSTVDNLPKKIKPSQSMPLKNKRQQLRKTSSSLKQQQLPEKKLPPSPQEIYSSSAYINSNINLTKAFRQKRGHMASLIPIASSKAISATKSV